MRCLKLPCAFDPGRLREDLARIDPGEWTPHLQRRHYEGEWSGAALRSKGGVAGNLVPEAHGDEVFRDTALLGRCPYFREVLARFACPLQAARLLRLHAGSNIAEHVDRALDFEDGEVRLHIPIATSDAVKFYLDGARLIMAPGECWYTNVNLPHSVENGGTTDRIHLVIDCLVDDWLRDLFSRTPPPPCDHYAARFTAHAAPEFGSLLALLSSVFAPGTRLQAEGKTLSLTWRGRHAWQFRLHLPAAPDAADRWTVRLESSPDPERLRRADYVRLVARIAAALPAVSVTHDGLV